MVLALPFAPEDRLEEAMDLISIEAGESCNFYSTLKSGAFLKFSPIFMIGF